jgi:hypothetical protein
MAGRDLENVARTDLELDAVGHLDPESAAQRDADVVELA